MSVQEASTNKPKRNRVKKVEEKPEPELCGICMDNYTPIIKKKVVCKYCKADSCSKCIERYLLDRHEDAHCLHCRVNYNDTTLHEICTKTYVQQVYFKHRQEVLINRERANLPGLQDIAIDERRKRDNEVKIGQIKLQIIGKERLRDMIMTDYNKLYTEYYTKIAAKGDTTDIRKRLDDCLLTADKIRTDIATKRDDINRIRWPAAYGLPANGTKPEEERKKFIRRCTRDGCQGFLSTAWKCGICEYYSCSKCFVTKTKKHDDPHECKKEDVETADMIKKDSKPCPNCGEFIMKSSGCFAKDTPILLWNGSTKMSQDIQIGDELVGDDGTKRTVLDLTSGVDTMYEVHQSNGLTYVVNSKHTLVLKYNNNLSIDSYIYNKLNYYKTSDTQYHIIIDDYVKLDNDIKNVLVGYKLAPYSESTIKVSEIGLGEYFGWKVDSNSKFLLTDTTVLRNCDQMFCISCQTPWSWTSGKVVTSGPIHNPHYYEWMKRNGGAAPRNPADIPCGGYPTGWELRRMPRGMPNNTANIFFEFHRICQELQDISERTYRSHFDQTTTNNINVKFLLGDFDEKHWGQLLGKNEKKRKRDSEVQEIFAAFRMVAVELINRVQNYRSEDGKIRTFTELPVKEAELFIEKLKVEIDALINMINEALRSISISYYYSVPYIHLDGKYYSIKTKNFSDEVKKKRTKNNDDNTSVATEQDVEVKENIIISGPPTIPALPVTPVAPIPATTPPAPTTVVRAKKRPQIAPQVESQNDSDGDNDAALQAAIAASLEK